MIEPARRLGVLGGTFDPIHLGHTAIARAARAALELDHVLVVPAGSPPHKLDRPVSPAEDRLAMVELAIAGEPGMTASRIEIDRPGPSYAADTMTLLAGQERATGDPRELYFILSSEAVAALPAWRTPDRLLATCRLAVVPRSGIGPPTTAWIERHFPGRADRFLAIDVPEIPISGTAIRRRAAAGEPLDGLVAPAVETYIHDHRLYTHPVWRQT